MRFRRTLAAITMAGALATSSCYHGKYIGMSAHRQYKTFYREMKKRIDANFARRMEILGKPVQKVESPNRYPCEQGVVLPGLAKTHAYVFLQTHENPFTGKSGPDTVQSQTKIYRVLQHLAKKRMVDTVIYEGVPKSLHINQKSKPYRESISAAKDFFRRCVAKAKSIFRSKKRDPPKQKEVEDVCLINFYVTSRVKNGQNAPPLLLLSDHPGLSITGFEKRTETSKKISKLLNESPEPNEEEKEHSEEFDFRGIRKILMEMKNQMPGENILDLLADPAFAPRLKPEDVKKIISVLSRLRPDLKDMFKSWEKEFVLFHRYGKYAEEVRSKHAVDALIARSSQNTALVIGSRHFLSMVFALEKIDTSKRPTVHFIEDECTNRDSFVTPIKRMSAIVDVLTEEQKPSK